MCMQISNKKNLTSQMWGLINDFEMKNNINTLYTLKWLFGQN